MQGETLSFFEKHSPRTSLHFVGLPPWQSHKRSKVMLSVSGFLSEGGAGGNPFFFRKAFAKNIPSLCGVATMAIPQKIQSNAERKRFSFGRGCRGKPFLFSKRKGFPLPIQAPRPVPGCTPARFRSSRLRGVRRARGAFSWRRQSRRGSWSSGRRHGRPRRAFRRWA